MARFDQVTRGMFNVGKASVLVFFDYDALKLEDLVPYKKDNSRKRRASDYRDRRFQARIRCSAAVPGDEAVDTTSGDERSSDSDSGYVTHRSPCSPVFFLWFLGANIRGGVLMRWAWGARSSTGATATSTARRAARAAVCCKRSPRPR